MAAQTIKGYVRFAWNMNIAVLMQKATEPAGGGLSFSNLCPTCHTQTKAPVWCPQCNKEVERDKVVKGYKYEKNKFALFQQEELKKADVEDAKQCDIEAFVDADSIDPIRVEDTYYLAPNRDFRGGAELFAVMREGMKVGHGKACMGKITLFGRQRQAAIMPAGRGMIMHLLRLEEQIRKIDDVDALKDVPEQVKPAELLQAQQFLADLPSEYDFGEMKDEEKARKMDLIQARIANQPLPEFQPKAVEATTVVDIMSVLQQARASVASKKKQAAPAPVVEKPVAAKAGKGRKKTAA